MHYPLEIVSYDYIIREKFYMYNHTSAHALACPHAPILLCSFIFALPDICAPNTLILQDSTTEIIIPSFPLSKAEQSIGYSAAK